MSRVYLSPPDIGALERQFLLDAFDSNWIAPLGPHVDAFEREFAAVVGVPHAVALSSGTAALHLALVAPRRRAGRRGARARRSPSPPPRTRSPTCGAKPVFIDSEPTTLEHGSRAARARSSPSARSAASCPRRCIAVDLYGQCADYDAIARGLRSATACR